MKKVICLMMTLCLLVSSLLVGAREAAAKYKGVLRELKERLGV